MSFPSTVIFIAWKIGQKEKKITDTFVHQINPARPLQRTCSSKWKFVIRGDDGGEVVIRHARKPFHYQHTHTHTRSRERILLLHHLGSVLFSARRSSWLSHLSAFILYFSPERPYYLNRILNSSAVFVRAGSRWYKFFGLNLLLHID